MNNRKLLTALVILLVVFLGGKMWKSKSAQSFDPILVSADTTRIDKIRFESPDESFDLIKTSAGWKAEKESFSIDVSTSAVSGILGPIAGLTADRIVSTDPQRYAEFEIEDEQAHKVTVFSGKKQITSVLIGGFRLDQVARTASTYLRKADDPAVYVTDGFTALGLKVQFDQFRDKQLVKIQAEDLSSVEWTNAGGRKEVIQKEEGVWYYAGMEAVDSSAFQNYLTSLVSVRGNEFSTVSSSEGLTLTEKITLYGNNMVEPTQLRAYLTMDTLKPFIIHSMANPQGFFTSDSSGLYQQIFTDLKAFFPNG